MDTSKNKKSLFERIVSIVSKQPGFYVVEDRVKFGPFATPERAAEKWAERDFAGEVMYFDGRDMGYPK